MNKHLSKTVIIIILAIITLVVVLRKKSLNPIQTPLITQESTQVIIKTETIIRKVLKIETLAIKPITDNTLSEAKTNKIVAQKDNKIIDMKSVQSKDTLSIILSNGKPSIIDFGADYCQPCKIMKPIFAELEKEYKNKVNILLLDINIYKDLANQYKIRLIPTQIFFDKKGAQYWRHEGYLTKEEIIKKLQELGIE